jgi:hypothetical protein
MFKIARTVKQIFNVARNIPKSLLSSINSGLKYCSQSKGYVEDAGDEFTFTKVLPDSTLIQDRLKVFAPNSLNIAKVKHVQLLDSAETRKLIYTRFADEISAKPSDAEENKNLETKSHATREYVKTFTTYSIADEFNDLREQGYDFAAAKKAVQNQNNSKTLSERMKELVISGYISRYSGESGLKEEVEELMDKHVLVIKEFMQKVNDEAVSDICEADLLGEY